MDVSKAKCPECGNRMKIVRTHCSSCEIAIEGEYEISPLGRLPLEDQVFVTAFLRSHGSIKQMERLFGISYPTVKNRLNFIAAELDRSFEAPADRSEVLAMLDRGEITVQDALERME